MYQLTFDLTVFRKILVWQSYDSILSFITAEENFTTSLKFIFKLNFVCFAAE